MRALGIALGISVIAALTFGVVARSLDGPVGFVPGGPLVTGQWESTSGLDWSFVGERNRLEMQLIESSRSRTLSMVALDGSLYLPCGLPGFKLWKQWAHEALEDGRAILRVDGKRYPVTLVLASEPERLAILEHEIVEHELDPEEASDPDLLWVFRADPRERGSGPN